MRVYGGLAAGEVHDIELAAMIAREVFENLGEALHAHVKGAVVLVVHVTNGTIEVAGARDGDDGQSDFLCVARAGTAVEGATVIDFAPDHLRRHTALLNRARALVPLCAGREPDGLWPVLVAGLLHPHLTRSIGNDVRRHRVLADLAQARGLVEHAPFALECQHRVLPHPYGAPGCVRHKTPTTRLPRSIQSG